MDQLGFVWDPFESSWREGFAALKQFKARETHCHVPTFHVEGKFRLGQWANVQRQRIDILPAERRELLDAIGFIWDPVEKVWNEEFVALTQFKAREGHCRVPALCVEGKVRLGQWVSNLRQRKDNLSAEQKKRLDDIGFVWKPLGEAWQKGFAALKRFKAREGHCSVPVTHEENGYQLGKWASHQRNLRDSMSVERRQQLDELGFVWEPFEMAWEEGFSNLTIYKNREGHCLVPEGYKENGFPLAAWVSRQRSLKDNLSEERRQKLTQLGFSWNPFEDAWDEGFRRLDAFKRREGHCRVPKRYFEGGFKLGRWVEIQRRDKGKLSPERLKKLNDLGFIWNGQKANTTDESMTASIQTQNSSSESALTSTK
jgi:Helicase associated domain